jgi:hypothetical protein
MALTAVKAAVSLSIAVDRGNDASESKENELDGVQVSLRIRPMRSDNKHMKIEWEFNEKAACIVEKTAMGKKQYDFDHTFMGDNAKCYKNVGTRIVKKALDGFNGTIFAYGQTGSGKTHSMLGSPWPLCAETEVGILPLALDDIFKHIAGNTDHVFLLRCSYMEIYNEQIMDLLHTDAEGNPAQSGDMKIIADDPIKGAVIGGLHEVVITSTEEACECLVRGEENRHVAGTSMNARSSRSHCIFRIVIERKMTKEAAARQRAKMAMFDEEEDDGGMVAIGGGGGDDGDDPGKAIVFFHNHNPPHSTGHDGNTHTHAHTTSLLFSATMPVHTSLLVTPPVDHTSHTCFGSAQREYLLGFLTSHSRRPLSCSPATPFVPLLARFNRLGGRRVPPHALQSKSTSRT